MQHLGGAGKAHSQEAFTGHLEDEAEGEVTGEAALEIRLEERGGESSLYREENLRKISLEVHLASTGSHFCIHNGDK